MARRKITATTLDGTTFEATSEFMALADRVAFERKFGVSTAVLTKHARLFDEGGNLRDDADPSELADQREEFHAFLSWRVLDRGGCAVGEFDDFLEKCASISVGVEEGETNPTNAGAQRGT